MAERAMKLEDWLDDLCVRFIINLPHEDLSSPARICFQIEEAQWFYEDFIRPLDPTFPAMTLRTFCLRIFQHCPILADTSVDDAVRAFEEFLQYKTRVPVRGAILLNRSMDSVVLVKGWKKGASWSFPRGKINKDEDDLDCAVREVYEETGYDIKAAGLVPDDRKVKYIDITMREQQMRLFVFRNVPVETHFEPRTRKEISKIQWYSISDLPSSKKKRQQASGDVGETAAHVNKFYMVAPFLDHLRKWIAQQRKNDIHQAINSQHLLLNFAEDVQTEDEQLSGVDTFMTAPGGSSKIVTPQESNSMGQATADILRMINAPIVQQDTTIPVRTSTSSNSGGALLALLRSDPPQTKVQATHQVGMTEPPLDIPVSDWQVPKTSSYHHPQPPLRLSNSPPPPTFTFDPLRKFNPFHGSPEQELYPPSSQQLFPQAPSNPAQIPRTQQNGYQNGQSQQLQHPQPLPPQVQRAVFAGGQVHGPVIDQPTRQQFVPTPPVSQPYPQFPNIHGPMIPKTTTLPTPKLTSHTLALLNHFKNHDQVASGAGDAERSFPLQRFTQENSAPAPYLPRGQAEYQSNQELQFPEVSEWKSKVVSNPSNLQPVRTAVAEEHRSLLLNMFKSPNTAVSHVAKIAAESILDEAHAPLPSHAIAGGPTPSEIENVSAGLIYSSAAIQRNAGLENEKEFESNGPHSSFRPVSILARPHQIGSKNSNGESSVITNQRGHPSSSNSQQRPASHQKDVYQLESTHQPSKPFQPQILKRPPQTNSVPLTSTSSPSSTALPSFAAQPITDSATAQSQEHKQNLLSLFGKPQVTILTHSGRTQPITAPGLSQQNSGEISARSLVDSAVSAGGDLLNAPIGRGSQTPISQANKGFLLGYLDAVANNSR